MHARSWKRNDRGQSPQRGRLYVGQPETLRAHCVVGHPVDDIETASHHLREDNGANGSSRKLCDGVWGRRYHRWDACMVAFVAPIQPRLWGGMPAQRVKSNHWSDWTLTHADPGVG